jgi:hypothetical protein
MAGGLLVARLSVALQSAWVAPFVAFGWLFGVIDKAYKLAGAAIAEGYARGAKL